MPPLLWDASALAKRYAPEVGSLVVDWLFDQTPAFQRITTTLSYVETFSILIRKRNAKLLSPSVTARSISSLHLDFIEHPRVTLLSLSDDLLLASLFFVQKYNLNASDAGILSAFLNYRDRLPLRMNDCILITSDMRLIRAATSEGMKTLNPEAVTLEEAETMLASP